MFESSLVLHARKAAVSAVLLVSAGCLGTADLDPARGEEPDAHDPAQSDAGDLRGDAGDLRGPDAGVVPPEPLACNEREGGALITLQIGDELLTFYATNQDFLEDAFVAVTQGSPVNVVFRDLHDGADCDAQWSWHPDPEDLVVSEATSEGCDVLPSQVEADEQTWVEPMVEYCPSKVLVTAFQGLGE